MADTGEKLNKQAARSHRQVLLDKDTDQALEYLRVRLSPEGERHPLDANTIGRVVLAEAQNPLMRDVPLDFPYEIYGLEDNRKQEFYVGLDLLGRWKELTALYQQVVEQQLQLQMRPNRPRGIKVKDADILRLLIARKAAQLKGPAKAQRGRPKRQA